MSNMTVNEFFKEYSEIITEYNLRPRTNRADFEALLTMMHFMNEVNQILTVKF